VIRGIADDGHLDFVVTVILRPWVVLAALDLRWRGFLCNVVARARGDTTCLSS